MRGHIHRGFQHLGLIPTRLKPWFRWLLVWRRLSPPALFIASFVVLIAIATAGLMWIPGLERGRPLGFVDAWFTMTSAVCVTGMSVVDTASHFTIWGQAWLLLFVQIGGLGLISLTTLLIGALGARLSLRSEMLTMAPPRHGDRPQVWQIAANVTRFSLVVEGAGVVLLTAIFAFRYPFDEAVWHATFHSISAYCNAGFSTFSTSLLDHADNPLALLVISALVILGGLGYLTIEELTRWWRHARARREGVRIALRGPHRLSSHTWAVLVTSTALLVLGFGMFAVFEWNDTLAAMSLPDKLANAWFMSVTPRSAGFNSIDYSQIGNDSAALTIMLMFVGGSPGSTAGGVKTTTLAVLVALGLSRMRGLRFVGLKQRAIPEGTVERTVGIVLLAMLIVVGAFFVLSSIESAGQSATESREQFLPLAFETVSAFTTTGLSMHQAETISPAAKVVLIWLMFIGRVGLFSFFTAIVLKRGHADNLRPAQEDVIVG